MSAPLYLVETTVRKMPGELIESFSGFGHTPGEAAIAALVAMHNQKETNGPRLRLAYGKVPATIKAATKKGRKP